MWESDPAALVDPIAEPPLAKGGASNVENKQGQDEQAGGRASTRCHVELEHRQSHAPTVLLLPCGHVTKTRRKKWHLKLLFTHVNKARKNDFNKSMFCVAAFAAGGRSQLPPSLTSGKFFF